MDQCAACAMELALMRRLFASLDAMPLVDPGPRLAERVLERVVPARVRRRWMRVVGWSYAAAFVALIGVAMAWIAQPGTQEMLGSVPETGSLRLTGALIFALEALSFATRTLAGASLFLAGAFEWLAPIARAFAPWLTHPSLRVAVPAALLACSLVVWWMRTREARESETRNHVAILGV